MRRAKRNFRPMSEINVTPFVDVMLVLLIIFMVTAPMMQQGLEIDLPKAAGKGFSRQSQVIVSISKSKNIYINEGGKTKLNSLAKRLKNIQTSEVLIKADSRVPYGFVIKVMAQIKKSGIDKVGLITNPENFYLKRH